MNSITKRDLLILLSKIIGADYNKSINIKHKNFIGFFQWDDSIPYLLSYEEKCLFTINYFEQYFKDYWDDIITVTSLIIDEKFLNKTQIEYSLAKQGLILPLNYNFIFSKNKELHNELISSFRIFSEVEKQNILNLSFVCMGSDILKFGDGYLFFIIPKLNLIIYPHSDIGFGCLFINQNKDFKKGIEFLNGWSNSI